MKTLFLKIGMIGLGASMLLGAGCARVTLFAGDSRMTSFDRERAEHAKTLATFQDESLGLTFTYPKTWGTAQLRAASVPGIDNGERKQIVFSEQPQVSVSVFSLDFKEGISEGNPTEYFSLEPDIPSSSILARLRSQFTIVGLVKMAINTYRMVHTAQYVGGNAAVYVSYLQPQRLSGSLSEVMTVYRTGVQERPTYTADDIKAILERPEVKKILEDTEEMAQSMHATPQ